MKKRMILLGLVGSLFVAINVAAWQEASLPLTFNQDPPAPTRTLAPTRMLSPTNTPHPTLTPRPTATPTQLRDPTYGPARTPTANPRRLIPPAIVEVNSLCSQLDAPGSDNHNLNEEYVCLRNARS